MAGATKQGANNSHTHTDGRAIGSILGLRLLPKEPEIEPLIFQLVDDPLHLLTHRPEVHDIEEPSVCLSVSTSSYSLLTRALLMYSSWQALPFSFLPPQAFRAEACRARPKEKVRAQGRCREHWFMAFRLSVASSSLWPPERKVTPVWGECIGGKKKN